MRLRVYGEERWAHRRKAYRAKQQAKKKRRAAASNTLPPEQPMQRCSAKGGAKQSALHYATDFYAKPVPGKKQGQQSLVLGVQSYLRKGNLLKALKCCFGQTVSQECARKTTLKTF